MEILETIANPFRILEGGDGELLSICEIEKNEFLGCGVSYKYSRFRCNQIQTRKNLRIRYRKERTCHG